MNNSKKRYLLYAIVSYIMFFVFAFPLKYMKESMGFSDTHPLFVIPFLLFPGNCVIACFWFLICMIKKRYEKLGYLLHLLLLVMWIVIFVGFFIISITS